MFIRKGLPRYPNLIKGRSNIHRLFSQAQLAGLSRGKDWAVFPNEKEGDQYKVNWSLVIDGITPVGDAFRNARLPLLTSKLPAKIDASNKVELKAPLYNAEFSITEAGDTISFDEFQAQMESKVNHFESGIEMFVEDAGLGSYYATRVPLRVVTDDAAIALITRALLIPIPPKEVDHRAKYNGWNHDERWKDTAVEWTGQSYSITTDPIGHAKGERPIVAIYGHTGKEVSLQFVEADKKIVGK